MGDHIKHTIVTLVSVEPTSVTVNITRSVNTTTESDHSREATEHRGLLIVGTQEIGSRDVRPVGVGFESTICTGTTGVDDALGDLIENHWVNLLLLHTAAVTVLTRSWSNR